MAKGLEFLKDVVEDLITLEVATLTNPTDKPIPLEPKLEDFSDVEKQKLDEAKEKLKTAREDLVNKISAADSKTRRAEIRKAKKTVKERQHSLDELKESLGIFGPKDIFSAIRSKLTGAELVAYSRFELEGDSVNFITNKASLQEIAESHKEMVAASQEARKALFDTVAKVFR